MVKQRFGDAEIETPPMEICKAVFQRLTGPDGKGGVKRMDWEDIARYGRIRDNPMGQFRGTWHLEHGELLPL
ncbi:MAG: hypothetical protein ABR999_02740 [Methanoregula sp.]|jgi:hypothetical protein|uniref:hypothetical protein n=1 Tax=Methanoregula sp. TaxID=2052170 RepID=UPI003D0C6522